MITSVGWGWRLNAASGSFHVPSPSCLLKLPKRSRVFCLQSPSLICEAGEPVSGLLEAGRTYRRHVANGHILLTCPSGRWRRCRTRTALEAPCGWGIGGASRGTGSSPSAKSEAMEGWARCVQASHSPAGSQSVHGERESYKWLTPACIRLNWLSFPNSPRSLFTCFLKMLLACLTKTDCSLQQPLSLSCLHFWSSKPFAGCCCQIMGIFP